MTATIIPNSAAVRLADTVTVTETAGEFTVAEG